MATYEGFSDYDRSSYLWSFAGLGVYQPGSSSSTRLVFSNPDGTVTWLNGTGLSSNITLSWTALSSVEHRSADGSTLIERISGFDASIANNINALDPSSVFAFLLSLDDVLSGHSGVDVMVGHSGANTFNGSGGADDLRGGVGLDTFTFTAASQLVAGLSINGGSWNDGGLLDVMRLDFSGSVDLTPVAIGGVDRIEFANIGGTTVTIDAGASATDWRGGSNLGESHGWIGSAGIDTLIINNANSGTVGSNAWVFSNWTAGVDSVTLNGTASNDTSIAGTVMDDIINGLAGNDGLQGNAGNDQLNGGEDSDILNGGSGNDTLNGGDAIDIADYTQTDNFATTTSAITVTLNSGGNGSVVGGADVGTDTLISIEQVWGTNQGDTFILNDPGNNSISAFLGTDTANYSSQTTAMALIVRPTEATVSGSGVGSDFLSSVENIIAGSGNDVFTIAGMSDRLLDAGDGTDTIEFLGHPSAQGQYTINLASVNQTTGTATGTSPEAGTFTLLNFENVSGGVYADHITGNSQANVLNGEQGDDMLFGAAGNDLLGGGEGNDTLDGGVGIDTAVFSGNAADYTIVDNGGGHFSVIDNVAGNGDDGTDTIYNIEMLQFADGTTNLGSGHFTNTITTVLSNFTPGAGGWTSQDTYTRDVADINGDGFADIIGFGQAGTWVSLANGSGGFADAVFGTANFGHAQGWTSDDTYHRTLGDVNGDGNADIVGFGQAGTWISLANGSGGFADATFAVANFGQTQGWTSDGTYHREVGDVNDDGGADIVGFGQAGTWVSLANGSGGFAHAVFVLANFGQAQGWTSDDTYHREVGDVNGDGNADIVGFGEAGTWVALANGSGGFGNPTFAVANFGQAQGWTSNDTYWRELGDVNNDGNVDVVGFGQAGTWVSLANGSGGFNAPTFNIAAFGNAQGWTSDNSYHREIADINGDNFGDIIGFGQSAVYVSPGHDFLT